MSDNNMNDIKPVYSSQHTMSKEMIKDFCSVDFRRTKITFIIFFFVILIYFALNIIFNVFGWLIWLTAIMVAVINAIAYFRLKRAIKASYEKALISEGKEVLLKFDLFEDKIVLHREEAKREYFYHQVTKLFETKSFIMLHLQHNLHITIEKSSLNADVDEVKAFVIDKCNNVKKKKFVNCVNDEKWSIVFMIALFVVAIAGAVSYFLMK